MESIHASYQLARAQYAAIGVDTDAALDALDRIRISLHCWQGDDVRGFESRGGSLTGGIVSTGAYPGRARTPDELRTDLDAAVSLIPGPLKVNLHAFYLEDGGEQVERDMIEPAHFHAWAQWAKARGLGLDFNPTYFSHPLSAEATLSSADDGVRRFWVEHGRASRRIAAYLGRETGIQSINNLWIPDGAKERPIDTLSPRLRLLQSLTEIYEEKLDPAFMRDAVESKLFGIGCESYTVGSHEFYLAYAALNRDVLLTLDSGHFHPTEQVSAKLSACLPFCDELLLHVSRPVRWDSDHVVTLDDELQALMHEIVRTNALERVHIALDFFDGSINRVAAWVIGTRNTKKALLRALLEPVHTLRALEAGGDLTARLALTEEYKSYPLGAVWDYYCTRHDMPARADWLDAVRRHESAVQAQRT